MKKMKKLITIIFTLSLLNSCAGISLDSNNMKEKLLKFKNSKTHNDFVEK
jgi:PBP1b-binding outer membrane lipoprotein LpoB